MKLVIKNKLVYLKKKKIILILLYLQLLSLSI